MKIGSGFGFAIRRWCKFPDFDVSEGYTASDSEP